MRISDWSSDVCSSDLAFGAVLALAAQKAGAVGVAIDGYACDLPEIREMGMPLWCLGASVVTHRRLALAGEINVPVACGDVTVDRTSTRLNSSTNAHLVCRLLLENKN